MSTLTLSVKKQESVQSLAFKLTVLRLIFLCLSIEFSLATVILYAKNCIVHYTPEHKLLFYIYLYLDLGFRELLTTFIEKKKIYKSLKIKFDHYNTHGNF
jgi:hypothetical protein